MGKALIIFISAITFIGTIYSLGNRRSQLDATAEISADEFLILARNVALMGVDRAEQKLADVFQDYPDVAGSFEGGSYQASATLNGSKKVVVRSTGTVQSQDGRLLTFNIRVAYEKEPWYRIANAPPLFMEYPFIADGDMNLYGTYDVHSYTPSDGSAAPANTDVHTNGSLTINGNFVSVEGFGTYVTSATANPGQPSDFFHPNDNPSGGPTAYQTAAVAIPSLNPAAMAATLTPDSTTSGSVTISSTSDLPPMAGTRDDPFVWHIEGDLIFTNNAVVSVPGYAILLIDGDVDFGGHSRITTAQVSHEGVDESTVAYYAGSVARLNGNAEVWGQIFANSADVQFNGGSSFYGSIVTFSDLRLGGTADLYYRQVSPALTTYFQGGVNDRLVRIAYSEW